MTIILVQQHLEFLILLKNVSMIANMNFAERNEFVDGEYTGSKFKMEQFRLEMRGWITDKVFVRFRHRFTSSFGNVFYPTLVFQPELLTRV